MGGGEAAAGLRDAGRRRRRRWTRWIVGGGGGGEEEEGCNMTVCGGLVVCGGSTRSSCCHTSPTTGGVSVSLGHMEVQNQIKLDIIVNCPLDRHHPDKTTFDNFELSSSTFDIVVNCPGVLHHLDEINNCQLSTTCRSSLQPLSPCQQMPL